MKHLEENNVSYFEHLWFSWSIGLALLVHGLVPTLFTTYASDKIKSTLDTQEE